MWRLFSEIQASSSHLTQCISLYQEADEEILRPDHVWGNLLWPGVPVWPGEGSQRDDEPGQDREEGDQEDDEEDPGADQVGGGGQARHALPQGAEPPQILGGGGVPRLVPGQALDTICEQSEHFGCEN